MDPETLERDRAIVEQIKAGDQEALGDVFRAFHDELHAYAVRYVNEAQVADDLLQDVFLRIWRRRKKWHLRHSMQAYLYGAVRNRSLKYLKHCQVRRDYAQRELAKERTPVNPPAEHLRAVELQSAIDACLDDLPERRREIFVLSRYHHLTYREIADVLGISIKTVETQMMRALRLFRTRLEPFRAAA